MTHSLIARIAPARIAPTRVVLLGALLASMGCGSGAGGDAGSSAHDGSADAGGACGVLPPLGDGTESVSVLLPTGMRTVPEGFRTTAYQCQATSPTMSIVCGTFRHNGMGNFGYVLAFHRSPAGLADGTVLHIGTDFDLTALYAFVWESTDAGPTRIAVDATLPPEGDLTLTVSSPDGGADAVPSGVLAGHVCAGDIEWEIHDRIESGTVQ